MFSRPCDVIVEVCHPHIVKEFGLHFLSQSHVMVNFFPIYTGVLNIKYIYSLSLLGISGMAFAAVIEVDLTVNRVLSLSSSGGLSLCPLGS